MQAKDRNNQAPTTKQKTSVLAFFVSILNEAAEFKGWQAIFQILLWTFVMWAVYNLKILYEFHNAPEYAHIPKYSIYDFKLSLIFVAAFLVYKHVSQIVFYRFVRNILDPLKFKTEAEFDKKAKIGALWVANLIYYSASSITCYILFKDQDFFPKLLGGKGDAANVFKVLPSNIYIPNGVEFYMVQFACHLHTLIDYIVYRWRDPNFWEMFLHHSLSVFLIFFSYATNNIAVGILVLFVHDPCDVCLYLNRLMSDSKYKNIPVKAVIFGVFIYVWIYLRIYAFPRCIIKACFDFMSSADSGIMYSPYMFMTLMLTALVILHCYWLMNILRVMFNLIRGKTNYNVYDNKKGEKSDVAPRASS